MLNKSGITPPLTDTSPMHPCARALAAAEQQALDESHQRLRREGEGRRPAHARRRR